MFIDALNFIFDNNRVNGFLEQKGEDVEVFWQKFYCLQRENIFLTSDYWYIMNELFKGLTITCFGFSIIASFYGQNIDALVMLLFSVVFWERARYFSKRFVFSVTKIYLVLKDKNLDE